MRLKMPNHKQMQVVRENMQRCTTTVLILLVMAMGAVRADSRFAAPHLGLPLSSADARGRAMGGVGSAVGGEHFAFSNPARTVNFWRAGFNGSMAQNYTTLDDGTGSYDLRSTNFLGLRGIFPSYKGFVVGAGLYQWRDMNWSYTDTVDVTSLGTSLARKVESAGGLYVSRFSIARSIGDHVAFGMGIDWMFGQAERRRTLEFVSADYNNSQDAFNDKYSFVRPTFGMFSSFGSTNFGISYTVSRQGDRERELIYRENSTTSGILIEESLKMDFPTSWRLGISQRIGPTLVVSSDLEFEGWSESDVPVDANVTPVDQWFWGIGVEVLPNRADDAPWYRRFPVRAGYSQTTYGYELDGFPVGENVFSLGTGSYFGRNNGLLNVALEFINREVDSPAYPSETDVRLTVSLSIFEKWTRIRRRGRPGN
jgi:hypothetical protein